jgi:hypothetical protein
MIWPPQAKTANGLLGRILAYTKTKAKITVSLVSPLSGSISSLQAE